MLSRDAHYLEIEPPDKQKVEALRSMFLNKVGPLITGALNRIIDAVPE